ncbi:protein FAM177A1 isoform X2 [Etheostoma spectabile]|uniref:protein FAM177A1 isoform X2 n=1 Tax=Etheostoma spectabile TaxID=54343 RepID=UPI0013AEB4AF|nr:protein FAM177A1-like isoform X2 [Etheostoma spectabile]
MNNSQPETSPGIQETEFGSPALTKQRRITYFSSGETLEEEDSEEEEEEENSSNRPPFRERAEKTKLSFKNVALLVGRISLLTCDFLGERLAGALGLNAAKYQYAIDQHHRDHKTTSSKATDNMMEEQADTIHISGLIGSHYGATGDTRCPADFQESCHEKHKDKSEGCRNRAYQADED